MSRKAYRGTLDASRLLKESGKKDLADAISTVAGFANDLLDRRAVLGERQDFGNGLFASQITFVLQS